MGCCFGRKDINDYQKLKQHTFCQSGACGKLSCHNCFPDVYCQNELCKNRREIESWFQQY